MEKHLRKNGYGDFPATVIDGYALLIENLDSETYIGYLKRAIE